MNWKRGFFRVWILFAVVWVGFASSELRSKPYYPPSFISYDSGGFIQKVGDIGPDADQLNQLRNSGKLRAVTLTDFPEIKFFIPASEPNPERLIKSNNLYKFASDARSVVFKEHFKYQLSNFFWVGLLVPITLLLIGIAIGWALGGFKRSLD
jgi:hypothetical protein